MIRCFPERICFLWYDGRGNVDKKLSSNLVKLENSGYPFTVKIFSEVGHGGLAGEHPAHFAEEIVNAYAISQKESF